MSARTALTGHLVAQFRRPHGALGHVAGWIMAHRASNVRRNLWTVDLLAIGPEHRVLELGCGPGLALAACAARAGRGQVVGVDHSATMAAAARRRNAAAVRSGRVVVHQGSFDALPPLSPGFDKIFAVNAVMFAPDPTALLRRLSALLRPGGTIAITFQSRKPGATSDDSRRGGEDIAAALRVAGFARPRLEVLALRPVAAVCVLASLPAAP